MTTIINKMKNLTISAIVIAAITSAGSAFAGTTTNTITNGWETGTRKVKVDNVRVETGSYLNESFNIKIDSVSTDGDAGSFINYDGNKFTGSGFATQINGGVDPFTNSSTVSTFETGTFKDITNTSVVETVEFGNTSIEYRLDGTY